MVSCLAVFPHSLLQKIEENLNHKPGPNPIIVRGHYVNRRPFRKLCSASFFHIFICSLLFRVPVYPECLMTRNLYIIHLFFIFSFFIPVYHEYLLTRNLSEEIGPRYDILGVQDLIPDIDINAKKEPDILSLCRTFICS